MKRKASYDRSNVPCTAKRAIVDARGLTMGAADRKEAACILVTVRQIAPRNKWEREFVFWTLKLGIQVRRCAVGAEATYASREQVAADIAASGSAAFECYGSLESLEALTTLPCVERWEFMMTGAPSVRVVAAGTGPDKVKANPPKPKPDVIHLATPEDHGMTRKPTGGERPKWDAMGIQRGTQKPSDQ